MVVWSLEKKKNENRVVILFNDLLLEAKPMVKKGKKGEPDLQVLKYLHSWNLYHVSPMALPDTDCSLFFWLCSLSLPLSNPLVLIVGVPFMLLLQHLR